MTRVEMRIAPRPPRAPNANSGFDSMAQELDAIVDRIAALAP